tara:strand:- start:11 stop:628 length:618 start_codon:yes stop_codon:yes gene_type:complete
MKKFDINYLNRVDCAHAAMLDYIDGWMPLDANIEFPYTQENLSERSIYIKLAYIKDRLIPIFEGAPPGLGLGMGYDIVGCFDADWMPEEHIEWFETGAFYTVETPDTAVPYKLVMYSREETAGWFCLCLELFFICVPELTERLKTLQSRFYDVDLVKANLMKKLRGELPWDSGPCGEYSQEDLKIWNTVDQRLLDTIGSFYQLEK